MSPTRTHKDAGLILGLTQWVKVAVSSGVVWRHGSDPVSKKAKIKKNKKRFSPNLIPCNKHSYFGFPFSFFLFFFFFFFLFRAAPAGHGSSWLGVKSELQQPAYSTATAMPEPSRVCDLHHSSWQCQSLNPLSKARDWTHVLMDTSLAVTAEPQWELPLF